MSDSNTRANDATADEAHDDREGVIGAGTPSPDATEKDPADWVSGDEPMTGAQRSYLDTLAREAGETLPADLTKAEASQHIDRLRSASERVDGGDASPGDAGRDA
jgi:hypothetical protein